MQIRLEAFAQSC